MRNFRLTFLTLAIVFVSFGILQLGGPYRIFTETTSGPPPSTKNLWKMERTISRSMFAGSS